jgi:hypothetical protein
MDVTGGADVTDDLGDPAERVFTAEHARHLLGRLDPVLQGQDARVRAHERSGAARGVDHLPGLHAEDHAVDDTHARRVVGRDGRVHHDVTLQAVDVQACLCDRRQMCAASDEGDIVPGLAQARTEVTADPSHSDDGKAHGLNSPRPVPRCPQSTPDSLRG